MVENHVYLEFDRNWDLFWEQLSIHVGDLYVIKVIIKLDYIQLTFEKISEEIDQSNEEIEQSDEEISDPSERSRSGLTR